MLEIVCPHPECGERNHLHIEDYEFEPSHEGERIEAPLFCAYCDKPLALVVALVIV